MVGICSCCVFFENFKQRQVSWLSMRLAENKFTNVTLHDAKLCTPSIHIQELYLLTWKGMQCLMPLRMWAKTPLPLSLHLICLTGKMNSTKGACKVPIYPTRWRERKTKSPQPCMRHNHIPDKRKFRFSVGNFLQKTVQSTVFRLQTMAVIPDI